MQAGNDIKYEKINELLKRLYMNNVKEEILYTSIELANEILLILGANQRKLFYGETALDKAFSNSKFKNQKMETWYVKHPYLKGARTALSLFKDNEEVFESNFFWLNDSSSKARISASVMINPNWEDSELTMLPNYKVGVDFFLNNEGNSLLIAVSDKGNLRVVELNERLSNTQIEILNSIKGCFLFDGIDPKTGLKPEYEPQRTIHRKLWEALELKEVNKKFYIGISDHFEQLCQHLEKRTNLLSVEDIGKKSLQNFANRLIGRILFIWFLRKRSIIDESQDYFDIHDLDSTDYYNQKLKILFFETLNLPIKDRKSQDKKTPYLNGGLFEAHKDDLVNYNFDFPKGWFDSLYKHLNEFNFTTDESTPQYEQIAIDPEMLGRVFENLLASILPETSSAANEKKNKGAFYTPREIVDFMCKASLKQYLVKYNNNSKDNYGIERLIEMNDSEYLEQRSTGSSDLWGMRSESVKKEIIEAINKVKILDPACGSGAFPIGMLQLIVKTLERLSAVYDNKIGSFRLTKANEKIDTYQTKLAIIKHSLYGSDIEPMAVEISRLRSWLSLIIDSKSTIEPLPNLDFNFVCANSLIPLETTYQMSMFDDHDYEITLNNLRDKFFDSHDIKEKLKLKQEFSEAYDKELNDSNSHRKIQQLKTWNPFESNKPAEFFDSKIMYNIDKFSIVIGNPPYIGEKGNKNIFQLVKHSSLGNRFYRGKMDYFYFFYHLGIDLLMDNGVLSFITTNYFPTADNANLLRKDIFSRTAIINIVNFGEIKIFDSAKGQHNMILLLEKNKENDSYSKIISAKSQGTLKSNEIISVLKGTSDLVSCRELSKNELFDLTTGDYYIRINQESKSGSDLIEKIKNNSVTLGDVADINTGIMGGCDFLTNRNIKYSNEHTDYYTGDGVFVLNQENPRDLKSIELLKEDNNFVPFYKNSDIQQYWTEKQSSKYIIYSGPNTKLTKNAFEHLSKFKDILTRIREINSENPDSWMVLRRGTAHPEIFVSPKIVAPQRSKKNTFGYNELPWYASADVYYITEKNTNYSLFYILGVLNSKLVYYWLKTNSKRKGDMLELYRTPLSQIPIPQANKNDKNLIGNIVKEILEKKNVNPSFDVVSLQNRIDKAIFDIYQLSDEDINIIEKFENV